MVQRGRRRAIVVLLLLGGAFFAALPWLGCMASGRAAPIAFPNLSVMVGPCTYQSFPPLPNQLVIPGFTGPYWGYLVLGIVYLVAAIYAALTKRPL